MISGTLNSTQLNWTQFSSVEFSLVFRCVLGFIDFDYLLTESHAKIEKGI